MFKALLSRLGIENYPENFADFYGKVPPVSILDTKNIERLEARFGVFGEYTEKLISATEDLKKNEDLLTFAETALVYLYSCNGRCDAPRLKLAEIKEDSPLRYYPALILAALLPKGIMEYERRGFSETEIYQNLHGTFGARIAMSERLSRLTGLDSAGFGWLRLYCYAEVFKAGVFNVTPKALPEKTVVLRNKEKRNSVILVTDGLFHKSGKPLGNAECTDTEGSFSVSYTEKSDEFIGYPCINACVSPVPVSYKKAEWEIALKNGDGVAGIHIPRGADLSHDAMWESFRLSLKMTRERYPEFSAKGIHCATWMLDPRLTELLGERSRLSGFVNAFEKFPKRCGGDAVFTFVFNGKPKNFADLEEDTSLQKKIKEIYLRGGAINIHGGIITDLLI